MPLNIPADRMRHPRAIRGDIEFERALQTLRDNPQALSPALSMAAGMLLGIKNGSAGAAAAVYVAQMTLFPDTDYSE